MTQAIKLGQTDVQPLGRGRSIDLALVEGTDYFLDVKGWNSVSELLFFITPAYQRGPCAQGSFSLCTLFEEDSAEKKMGSNQDAGAQG